MIDRKRVVALYEDIGAEEFGPLVEMFMEEIEAMILALDMSAPAALPHRLQVLKGSASSLGLRALGIKCDLWARAAARGRVEDLDPAALMACHARSRQLLRRDFAVLAAGPEAVA